MIDCDELRESKVLRKVVDRKKEVRGEKARERKNRGVKTFHSLRVTSSAHTRTAAALEWHLPPSAAVKLLFLTEG